MVSGLPLPVALSFIHASMRLTSLAFADNLPIPSKYTCIGANISPPFEFIDVPESTVTLVLIFEDADSSNNRIHWLVYNIPGDVTHFDEGKIPEGSREGVSENDSQHYDGPCPKYLHGVHRFKFTLFALDIALALPLNSTAYDVNQAMTKHILESAELIGMVEGELAEK